jgi:hypothetical protein
MESKTNKALVFAALFSFLIFLYPAPGRAAHPGAPLPLPKLILPAPPLVVLIPGSNVYFPPEVSADLLFYQGYWYRPHNGRWYRASGYNGPWRLFTTKRVPRALLRLPRDYRRIPPGQRLIPYGQLKKNWRQWEREKKREQREEKREKHRRERRR